MLNNVEIDNLELVNLLQNIFCDVYKQKKELIMTIQSNPYVKICTYSVDKKIVGIIEYQDIYDRFELNKGSDETFLKFICEVFHPLVRDEKKKWESFLSKVNDMIRADGY